MKENNKVYLRNLLDSMKEHSNHMVCEDLNLDMDLEQPVNAVDLMDIEVFY